MELKRTNSNGGIVLASECYLVQKFFLKNCENYTYKWILQVIFSKRCLDCSQNKIVHNFHITYPNEMNQSVVWEKLGKQNPRYP